MHRRRPGGPVAARRSPSPRDRRGPSPRSRRGYSREPSRSPVPSPVPSPIRHSDGRGRRSSTRSPSVRHSRGRGRSRSKSRGYIRRGRSPSRSRSASPARRSVSPDRRAFANNSGKRSCCWGGRCFGKPGDGNGSCLFLHPGDPGYVMTNMCNFGDVCRRRQSCHFDHPQDLDRGIRGGGAGVPKAFTPSCRFGDSCREIRDGTGKCDRLHPGDQGYVPPHLYHQRDGFRPFHPYERSGVRGGRARSPYSRSPDRRRTRSRSRSRSNRARR